MSGLGLRSGASDMRRFLYILGTLTLIIVVAAGIGLGVFFYKGHALDADRCDMTIPLTS
jgi:hypothetical protein